jgi:hypothetical protein
LYDIRKKQPGRKIGKGQEHRGKIRKRRKMKYKGKTEVTRVKNVKGEKNA